VELLGCEMLCGNTAHTFLQILRGLCFTCYNDKHDDDANCDVMSRKFGVIRFSPSGNKQ